MFEHGYIHPLYLHKDPVSTDIIKNIPHGRDIFYFFSFRFGDGDFFGRTFFFFPSMTPSFTK